MTFQRGYHDIWTLLEIHEETISLLYNAYSNKFPEHKVFWSALAADEAEHARLLRQLSLEKKSVEYKAEKLTTSAVEISIEYLNDQLTNINKYDISLINALSIAVNFERSIMDGKIFEAFTGRSTSTKNILQKLTDGLKKHVATIEKVWTENRKFS